MAASTCNDDEARHTSLARGPDPWGSLRVFALAALGQVCVPIDATADDETVSFGVEDYNGAGQDQCPGGPTPYSETDAWQWKTDALATGFDVAEDWLGPQVDRVDFVDVTYSGGADSTVTNGTDWADVVFFSGHGGSYCAANEPLANRFNLLVPGDYDGAGSCEIRMGGQNNRVIFGTGSAGSDANYLMMHASKALRYCGAQSGNQIFYVDGGNSGTQLTLLNGFHNSPAAYVGNPDKVHDYVQDSTTSWVGDNWGDIMQYRNGNIQECAVTSTTCQWAGLCDTLYTYGGLRDYTDTGTHSYHYYYFDCSRVECFDLPWCQ
jgi:hypothetical protein